MADAEYRIIAGVKVKVRPKKPTKKAQRQEARLSARGTLFTEQDGKVTLIKDKYTHDELLTLLNLLGKRAQTRLATLGTYFNEKGKKYTGEINPVYEKYKGYNISYAGLTDRSLLSKVKTAVEILNAKQSTYTGYMSLQHKAYESLKKSHPKLKNLTFEQWKQMTVYMGAWQAAHEGEQYDSETLLAYTNWGVNLSQGADMLKPVEEVDLNKWFLDASREEKTGQWIDLKQDFDDI